MMPEAAPQAASSRTTIQGWRLQDDEQQDSSQRKSKIEGGVHRAYPDGVVERGSQDADHGGIGAAHRGLCLRQVAQAVPERQRTINQQRPGRKIAARAMAAPPMPLGCGPLIAPR